MGSIGAHLQKTGCPMFPWGKMPQGRGAPCSVYSRVYMNAKELLQSAPRLSVSNCAYVILENGERGILVPPGTSGKKITVRACDADGVQSGPVKKVSPKDLRLEPLPAPPAPLRLAPWCVNCGSPAMLRCTACGSSICGRECAEKRWKQHRSECRRLQAVAFGEEYARNEDRGNRLIWAGHRGQTRIIMTLTDQLSLLASKQKKLAKAADAAMRAFLDFEDPRDNGTAAYAAAQENHPNVIRLLHEMRADLEKPNTVEGGTPTGVAAQIGHTAMVQLLYDLGADIHKVLPERVQFTPLRLVEMTKHCYYSYS